MSKFDLLYDQSIKMSEINGSNMLSMAIGHFCLGPFRLVGRVFSNLCLLPSNVVNSVLLMALCYEAVFTICSIYSMIMGKSSILFIGCVASMLTTLVILVVNSRRRVAANKSETTVNIDKEQIEAKCNALPKKLDTILEEANL